MNNTKSACSKIVWRKQRQIGEFYKALDWYKWTSIRLLKCKLKLLIWREGAYAYFVKEPLGKYKTWEMDGTGSRSYLMLNFGIWSVEPLCPTKKDVLSINCLLEHWSTNIHKYWMLQANSSFLCVQFENMIGKLASMNEATHLPQLLQAVDHLPFLMNSI